MFQSKLIFFSITTKWHVLCLRSCWWFAASGQSQRNPVHQHWFNQFSFDYSQYCLRIHGCVWHVQSQGSCAGKFLFCSFLIPFLFFVFSFSFAFFFFFFVFFFFFCYYPITQFIDLSNNHSFQAKHTFGRKILLLRVTKTLWRPKKLPSFKTSFVAHSTSNETRAHWQQQRFPISQWPQCLRRSLRSHGIRLSAKNGTKKTPTIMTPKKATQGEYLFILLFFFELV